jgi:hypothetical protein
MKKLTATDIINAFLMTPLTKDGKDKFGSLLRATKLDEETFLSKCYVHPTFITHDSLASGLFEEQDIDLFIKEGFDKT